MFLRELFEASKTAAFAFGRMNPPTIGHKKLADAVAAQPGDPFIFVTQSHKPKTDPLDFPTKLKLAQTFFPNVTVGDASVKTIIQALQKVEKMGYTDIIYVAGSDRLDDFTTLLNKYNGKDYNFNSIKVVSAGERDPDAEGAEGMSASKMRAAAASGNLQAFTQGVPDKRLAQKMYDAVRAGMGVNDTADADVRVGEMAAYKGNVGIMELVQFYKKATANNDTDLIKQVKSLIAAGEDKQVWKIVQEYTGTALVGKEFEYESISEMINTMRKS